MLRQAKVVKEPTPSPLQQNLAQSKRQQKTNYFRQFVTISISLHSVDKLKHSKMKPVQFATDLPTFLFQKQFVYVFGFFMFLFFYVF